MMRNIMLVEREKAQSSRQGKTEVISAEKEKSFKQNLSKRELQLQAMAAAERARNPSGMTSVPMPSPAITAILNRFFAIVKPHDKQ